MSTLAAGSRLIVFDLDGTLIEFHHDFLLSETERILLHLEHPPVHRDTLIDHFSDFDFFRFAQTNAREEFIQTFWAHFDWAAFPRPKLFPHSLQTLELLTTQGFACAIATARLDPYEKLKASLESTGILRYVSEIVTRAGDHIEWTDKRAHFHELSTRFGMPPKDMVLIGDIPADIHSAKEAGVGMTIAVCSGGIKPHILKAANPDFVLPDVSHVPEILGLKRPG